MDRFEMFGLIAEWLLDEKIITSIEQARFQFINANGEIISRTIESVSYLEVFKWINMTPVDNNSSFALFNPRQQNYWFNYDEETKSLYCQFNAVNNQEGEPTIAEFTESLAKIIRRKSIARFIIDLRNNGGGDDSNLPPLLSLIKDSREINQYGKLFVITGRHTFSSALLFAWQLRMQTEAIFVGEPAAQGPVFNANAEYIFLPNSKLGFTVSKNSTARNQPNWCFDPPELLDVDYPVQYGIQDFKLDHDPALALISDMDIGLPIHQHGKDISGSYRISDFHVLNIHQHKKQMVMTITDFMDNSLFFVKKRMYFDEGTGSFRDGNGIFSIRFAENEGDLTLGFNGQETLAQERDGAELLPMEAMQKKHYTQAVEGFRNYTEVYKNEYIKFEYYLTMAGYNLLHAGKTDTSLAFFELLTEIFPDSWNAYDSYGEALAEANQKEEAIRNFKKSLLLNPDNENGKKWLEKLKE
jgi:hypothetical protein